MFFSVISGLSVLFFAKIGNKNILQNYSYSFNLENIKKKIF